MEAISVVMTVGVTPCTSSSLMLSPAVLVGFFVMHAARHVIPHPRLVGHVSYVIWWVVSALDAHCAWLTMYDVSLVSARLFVEVERSVRYSGEKEACPV